MSLAALVDLQASSADLIQSWAERDTLPRAVVDDELHVHWLNDAAQAELDRRRDLQLRDGRLVTTRHANQTDLLDFITGCGTALASWCFPCQDGGGHVLFRALEIGRQRHHRFFGLIYYRSGRAFTCKYADLEKVFQLTHAEHRVLIEMLSGHVADDIAQSLHVSIDTTRSHIRQIYLKLNVTSREGMFSRLRPYRLC